MALDKQNVPIIFQGGIDTKTAQQLVAPGSFAALNNCIRRKTGKIEKRYGFESLSNAILGAGMVSEGVTLSSLKQELLILNHTNLYSYVPTKDYWIEKDQLLTTELTQYPIVQNDEIQSSPDIATTNGVTLAVWREDALTGTVVKYSVLDNESNAYIVFNTLLSPGQSPKVIALGDTFLIGLLEQAAETVRFFTIDSNLPTVINTGSTYVVGAASHQFDMDKYSATQTVWAVSSITPQIHVGYATSTGTIGPSSADFAGKNGVGVLTIAVDVPNDYIYVAHSATTGQAQIFGMHADFSIISAGANLFDVNVRNVGMIVDTSGTVQILEEAANTFPTGYRTIRYETATWDGTIAPPTVLNPYNVEFQKQVALGSKPIFYDNRVIVALSYASPLQSTYFIYDVTNRYVLGKVLPGVGGGFNTLLPNAVLVASGLSKLEYLENDPDSFMMVARKKLELEAADDGTVLSTSIGLQKVVVNLVVTEYRTAELGANTHISGGLTNMYDGNIVTELNFNQFPENVTTAVVAGSSTFPVIGLYSYIVAYEWKDAQGQIHRSATSVESSSTISNTTDRIVVTYPFLTLTNKVDVRIVIYRTEAGGDIFYKLTDQIINDNTAVAGFGTYADQNQDGANLSSRAVLYTTGGVLDNEAPPACKYILKHQNRLFISGLENETSLEYTKEWVFGEGVNFSSFLTITVDSLGGAITALGTLDDKLIIFKKDRLFVMTGRGPTDNGAQNDFSTPELISAEIGCSEPESIVILPTGLMFKSDKGIYRLSRSLQVDYIGAGVEDFNNLDIRSVAVLEDFNEARFITRDGATLVYNYYFDQWSTFTNYTGESNLELNGNYYHLKPDGTVNVETPGVYNDNGSFIQKSIEFPWLSMAGVQGFQRIYWMTFLGDIVSPAIAELSLAYDFEPGYTEVVTFDTQTGDSTTVFQFRTKPARQKCESLKILLRDLDDTVTTGPGFTLVNANFQAGVKSGTDRLSGNNTKGSVT